MPLIAFLGKRGSLASMAVKHMAPPLTTTAVKSGVVMQQITKQTSPIITKLVLTLYTLSGKKEKTRFCSQEPDGIFLS